MPTHNGLRAITATMAFASLLSSGGVNAGSVTTPAAADTFINSLHPDNNNGTSASLFSGKDGQGGVMRGLLRFPVPGTLWGRATATSATVSLTARGLGSAGTTLPTAATLTLGRLTTTWGEGTGNGDATTQYVVGDPCSGTGATWNHPLCTTGTWVFPATTSASANISASLPQTVTWSGAGLVTDVQAWIDDPSTNAGWLLVSSTEGATNGAAQRFYSRESGTAPTLAFNYTCKAGLIDTGSGCSTCSATALSNCSTSAAGNSCVDSAPPSLQYSCVCGNAAYVPGTIGGSAACVAQTLDIDGNHAYDALTDGLLVIRYLFGVTGNSLVNGAIGTGATRTTGTDVANYLAGLGMALDVDGNGSVDALTDGLIVIRYLFGLRGPALTVNAIGPAATRTGPEIETYIQSRMP